MLTRDSRRFLMTAIRKPISVGAVAPSSRRLGRAMIRDIDLSNGQAILELGPGTGPFTRVIRDHLTDPSRYLGIERDPGFVRHLQRRFSDLRFCRGSAEDALAHLEQAGIDNVGAIICGLPFATLPTKVQDGVIDALRQLMKPGVVFRTFQYAHAWPMPSAARFRHRMNGYFGRCEVTGPVMRNVPPAVVLGWEGR
ncbi:MAG: methyltransferase domain-containing protein, partial [Phycisphaerae bacterium]|nr:methyltransferase domain-containing protein [Phycisphaerae bacterium]